MINIFLILLLNLLALWQSVLGILQVCGIKASGHARFALTGSFDNPGPYGGVIAVLCAILGAYVLLNRKNDSVVVKVLVTVSAISCALCAVVLPASMSRAAWLSLGVSAVVLGFREMHLKDWIKANRSLSIAACAVVLVLLVGIFFLKKDSAIGRLHIWHMELRAIAEKPWTGHGKGTVLGVYGETQADYFAQKERPNIVERVAGCPEYAFNEYLRVGVEYGIPAMLSVVGLLMGAVILLLKIRSPFAYGLIAFCVFSFFSYPLSALRVRSAAEKEWESIRYLVTMEMYEDAIEELMPLRDELDDNFRYLYDLGYSLHKVGRYNESDEVLRQGSRFSSDPLFHVIMGKNHEAVGRYEDAEGEYRKAHHMVPGRIYPISLLMNLNIKTGDNADAIRIGRKIKDMYVNEKVLTMRRLHTECLARLDSLENLAESNRKYI